MSNDCQFVLGVASLTPYRSESESFSGPFDRCAEQSVCGLLFKTAGWAPRMGRLARLCPALPIPNLPAC